MEKGSSPDTKDNNELNPFIAAGANGFSDLLKLMASSGADCGSTNRFGGTALLPASEKGYAKTVQYSLEAGVPVNHANKLGWTALHEAVILGDGGHLYALVIRLLIEAGADIQIKDRNGLSPVEYARQLGQQKISRLFEGTAQEDGKLHAELFTLYKEEHYEEGLANIRGASPASMGNSTLHFWKGLLLQESRKYNEAIHAYRRGLEMGSEGSQFHFCIAQCFRLMKQPKEALEALDKGREEKPSAFIFSIS
nr:ankyrin repeat domain-containing protein [Planococcus glaciei]